jgi:hypothetical protein
MLCSLTGVLIPQGKAPSSLSVSIVTCTAQVRKKGSMNGCFMNEKTGKPWDSFSLTSFLWGNALLPPPLSLWSAGDEIQGGKLSILSYAPSPLLSVVSALSLSHLDSCLYRATSQLITAHCSDLPAVKTHHVATVVLAWALETIMRPLRPLDCSPHSWGESTLVQPNKKYWFPLDQGSIPVGPLWPGQQ